MIEIINGGMLSTVQDYGRFGVMKTGFTQSGAMDRHSMQVANIICGNSPDVPVVEMTMVGITTKFTDEHRFCLSGGTFNSTLNGRPITNNKCFAAKAGDVLTVSNCKNGMRIYLAVSGGIDVPSVMGSASTNLKLHLGGYEGRALKRGDVLNTGKAFECNSEKEAECETYEKSVEIRVVQGPQYDMFTETDKKLFFSQTYCVTPYLDRMGIRLNGIALKGKDGLDIISDGICFGSIQIARSGMPIILMADHQTAGGYAKIANVISVDLGRLAQVKQNDMIKFKLISVKKAEKLALKEKKYIEKLARS